MALKIAEKIISEKRLTLSLLIQYTYTTDFCTNEPDLYLSCTT